LTYSIEDSNFQVVINKNEIVIKHHIGMEIQNPPQKYKEFVEGPYAVNIITM
jgi:hypothetical protein